MPQPLERGRNNVLYNYGPGKVFYHEKSRMIERIVAIKQDARTQDLRVNLDQLRKRIRQEIRWHADADLDADLVARTQLNVIQPDFVVSRASPMAYYCQRCGHLYLADVQARSREPLADLRRAVPPDRRCTCDVTGSRCNGFLVQYDYLTTHNCGEEIFVPDEWFGRCQTHGNHHLHWIRQGSERASRWSIACRVGHAPGQAGCQTALQANDAFFATHRNCPLENRVTWSDTCKRTFSTAPFMKATHYMPRVVNLLNSDNSLQHVAAGNRDALIAAYGCLRDAASFRRYHDYDGFNAWQDEYRGDAAETRPGARSLEELVQQLKFFEDNLPPSPQKEAVVAPLRAEIAAKTSGSQGGLPQAEVLALTQSDEYARQIRDTTLYMDRERSIGFADLVQQARDDHQYQAQLQSATQAMRALHIFDVRYQERVPVTTALVGFVRGAYDPREAKLNLFARGDALDVYASQSHTEALWIQLDPSATLRWLRDAAGEGPAPTGNFARDMLELQKRFRPDDIGLFGDVADHWSGRHYGLLHSVSHLFVKSAGRVTGLTQEGISEEILPYTNSFLVYANHSGEFTLGGLQLMMEYHMGSVLAGLRDDAHRCAFNPVCERKSGACPGCVHLAEVSCASFNRVLNRNFLVKHADGFWRRP